MTGAWAFTLIPAAATVLGAGVAIWRPPGRQAVAAVQHLAAGVVFAAVATEILPDIKHQGSIVAVVVGGGLGVLAMLAVKAVGQRAKGAGSLVAVVGVDILIDGLVLGLGFAAGSRAGVLLTIALTLEVMFLGLSVTPALAQALGSRARTLAAVGALATLLPIGALIGTQAGGLPGVWLAGFLSFGLVALLYLVTEELLVEAHEGGPEAPWIAAMFFVGFLALLILEEALG